MQTLDDPTTRNNPRTSRIKTLIKRRSREETQKKLRAGSPGAIQYAARSRVKDTARSLDDVTDDGGPRWMLQMVVLSRDSDAYSDIRVIGQAIVSIE